MERKTNTALTTPSPFPKKKLMSQITQRQRWGIGAVLVFLIIWEIIGSSAGTVAKYISKPSLVLISGLDWIFRGDFYHHIYISLLEIMIGFVFAVVMGIIVGLFMGRSRIISGLFDPLMMALYATPLVALIPLLIIWFGIGIGSKIAAVFLFAVFPVLLNTMTGIRQVDPLLIKAGRSFGATEWQLFRKILFPASLPAIISGMRLSWGKALIGMVIGEMYVSTAGLGHLITTLGNSMRMSDLFFIIIIVAGLGYLGSAVLLKLERKVMVWKEEVHNK
jgi:NitT/TauT family transport system permease protein